jgi:hypothetical protein
MALIISLLFLKDESHVHKVTVTAILNTTISKALIRDDFRCVVSGKYDSQHVDKNLELEKEVMKTRAQTAGTHCAHIFPASTNDNISGSSEGGAKVRLTYPLPS